MQVKRDSRAAANYSPAQEAIIAFGEKKAELKLKQAEFKLKRAIGLLEDFLDKKKSKKLKKRHAPCSSATPSTTLRTTINQRLENEFKSGDLSHALKRVSVAQNVGEFLAFVKLSDTPVFLQEYVAGKVMSERDAVRHYKKFLTSKQKERDNAKISEAKNSVHEFSDNAVKNTVKGSVYAKKKANPAQGKADKAERDSRDQVQPRKRKPRNKNKKSTPSDLHDKGPNDKRVSTNSTKPAESDSRMQSVNAKMKANTAKGKADKVERDSRDQVQPFLQPGASSSSEKPAAARRKRKKKSRVFCETFYYN